MKYTILIALAFALVGCGGSDTTYVKEAPALPETPTDGTNIIVSADGGSNVGLSYTEVGDGAILIECGDGDNVSCGNISVYEATEVTEVTK